MKRRGILALSVISRRRCQRRDLGPVDCKYYYVALDRRRCCRCSRPRVGVSRGIFPGMYARKSSHDIYETRPVTAPQARPDGFDAGNSFDPVNERRGNVGINSRVVDSRIRKLSRPNWRWLARSRVFLSIINRSKCPTRILLRFRKDL